jgi:flagellin-specific chaperone FliS
MTPQEKIELLIEALNDLMQSADNYIDDGAWIDDLAKDIERAEDAINQVRADQ